MSTHDRPEDTKAAGMSRRQFVTTMAGAGAGLMIVPRHVLGRGFQAPSDLVNVAVVGIHGMGAENARAVMSQNIVAICDCDFGLLDGKLAQWTRQAQAPPRAATQAPPGGPPPSPFKIWGPSKAQLAANAKWPAQDDAANLRSFVERQIPRLTKYRDYREMLEKQKDLDAIIVATPDHMHAVIASNAMDAGKHVYVQKPLCWSVHEARHLQKKAAEKKSIVTQMGNQRHSSDGERRAVEYIMGGAIGEVREVHVWTNRPYGFWPQGVPRPAALTGDPARVGWDNRGLTQRIAASMDGSYPAPQAPVVGSVSRRRTRGAVPPDLPPVQLARLGGLGPGRARRHGRAPDRLPDVGVEARAAHRDRDRGHAVQRRDLSECDDHLLRVPETGRGARGEAQKRGRRRAHAPVFLPSSKGGSSVPAVESCTWARRENSSRKTTRGSCRLPAQLVWRAEGTARTHRARRGTR